VSFFQKRVVPLAELAAKNSIAGLFRVEPAFRLASKSFIEVPESASADDRGLAQRSFFLHRVRSRPGPLISNEIAFPGPCPG
jgi:hypothetical protein